MRYESLLPICVVYMTLPRRRRQTRYEPLVRSARAEAISATRGGSAVPVSLITVRLEEIACTGGHMSSIR